MYDENHVTVVPKSGSYIKSDRYKLWDCFLCGELVGGIQFITDGGYKKHYESQVCDSDGRGPMRFVGRHNSLYEAKVALVEPAREYLQKKKEYELLHKTPAAALPESDCQFFPTPPEIAGKLLSAVDWKCVETILEPSAGRGDLIECAIRRNGGGLSFRYGRCELDDIDCIEIDPNLRALLIGKGFRVVHDDFLTYHTRKRYSLILMNPPFSEGDKHLLHALELCEHGGQIACILNAETIRNPFTNSRKLLARELKKHGASIRFISKGFSGAARKTDVDVALINVSMPVANTDTSIWDDLKKAQEMPLETTSLNEVAPANQIDRLIREYDLLCEAGIALMQKYNGVAPRIHNASKGDYTKPIIEMSVNGEHCGSICRPGDLNRFLRAARSRYWQELFDLPELRSKMTSAMRDEYSSTISRMRDYEFSEFNIRQVLDRIMGQIVTGVEDAILNCFDKLSAEHSYNQNVENGNVHYYNGWKTNKAHYVNSKCVIPTYGCFARGYKTDKHGNWKDTLEGLDVHGCFSTLDDLEKALDYIDCGETVPTSLERALKMAADNGVTSVPCKYFSVTFYKKGTCHIKFYDQKIVDKLNIYVGRQRMWLPPTYGKVHYDDMDSESQHVVDEFQGKEKYDEIMRAPEKYIIEAKTVPLLIGGEAAC